MTAPDELLAPIRARLAAFMAEPCKPSEKSMGWTGPVGGCWFCDQKVTADMDWADQLSRPMIVCTECGNKRCPRASWHGNACTGSNEPQQGGDYPEPLPAQTQARLLAALDGVLALHTESNYIVEEWTNRYGGSYEPSTKENAPKSCEECGREVGWPCPTVAAVTTALEGQG